MFGYRYYLLSPHKIEDENLDTFNQIYDHWKFTFSELLGAAGGTLQPDDFFRNDYVSAIMLGSEVVVT